MADYKKIKHHQMPGDVSIRTKINMREGRIRRKGVKAFLKVIYSRMRAVLKRRTEEEIANQIETNT